MRKNYSLFGTHASLYEQDDDYLPTYGGYGMSRYQPTSTNYRALMGGRTRLINTVQKQSYIRKTTVGSLFQKPKPIGRGGQKKKIPRKQINKDYTFKGDLIEANQHFSDGDCKKLKKYCANIVDNAENILIKYSRTKPTLLFEYQQGTERKQIHFREVVRGNKQKKIMVDCQLFLSAFDKLYDKVSDQYYQIGKFAMKLGDEKKLFKFKSIDIKKDKNDLRFYYCVGQGKGYLNFILFKKDLFYIQFNTNYIQSKKLEYPDQYKIYEKLKQNVSPDGNDDDDLIAGQEIESGEGQQENEEEEQEQLSTDVLIKTELDSIKKNMRSILQRNIENEENLLQAKNEECDKLRSNDGDKAKLQKLSEQVGEMYDNIENFKQVKLQSQLFMEKNSIKSDEQTLHQHRMYQKKLILAQRQMVSKLPVLNKKRQIFNYLDKNSLIIIEGETGSGKSTQLPQILCQYFQVFSNEKSLPILITQPRKLATRSLAERVAFEMHQKLGQFVEYESSYNNRRISENAKIYFKLDRLLLDELTVDPRLSKYQCLVIDQAHQRTISIDVILGRVKEILKLRKDFKVIVTSASLDTELFKQYFSAPILKISGRMYPVVEIFKPYDHIKDTKQKVQKLILEQIIQPDLSRPKKEYQGHMLVFCSGIDQITSFVNLFQKKLPQNSFKILSLHGRMTGQQQAQVFRESKLYKIIFATRIAETSITINGIKVVVDPGFDREMIYDQKSKISSMQLRVISESSAKQRAGRAGRTNSGFCFRLYDEEQKRKMQLNKTPEIQNMSLDSVVLRLKSLQIQDILTFPYLSKPDAKGLKMSVQTMKTIGCLDEKQKITEIGQLLVKIPIQPFLSRAIIESIFFQIALSDQRLWNQIQLESEQQKQKLKEINLIKTCTRILAMLINSSSLFIVKQNERESAEKNKFNQFPNLSGDFYLFQCIYSKFINLYAERRNEQLRLWTNQNYLSLKTLHQAREIESQIETIIRKFVFDQKLFKKQLAHAEKSLKLVSKADDVIMACLMSSFVTNICLFSDKQQIGYTLMSQQIPISLYGTTILSLQGNSPKWIVCYDLYTNQNNQTFCKVAQSIQFQFVKKIVRKEVFELFNLQSAEQANPFYQNIKINVPSIQFLHILNDYRRKDSLVELSFLNNFNFFFNQLKNEITIFYLISKFKNIDLSSDSNETIKLLRQNDNDYRLSKNPKEIIEGYFAEVRSNFKVPFKMDYVGQISIEMVDGSVVKNINFKKSLYSMKVISKSEIVLSLVQHFCKQKYQKYDNKLIFEVEGEANREKFKKNIQLLQLYFKEKYRYSFYQQSDYSIKLYEQVVDKRHKIPKAKLFLTFYAGTPNNPTHIFLNYKKYENEEDQISYIKLIMHIFQQKLSNLLDVLPLNKISISKNHSGLNVYTRLRSYDEIEVMDKLIELDRRKQLGFGFQLPQSIIKYREPELSLSNLTDSEWEAKIRNLIKKAKIEAEDITIKIWGSYKRNRHEGHLSIFQKNMRVNMFAQISSFSINALQQFKKAYDKRDMVLGCGKLHIKFQFSQTVASVSSQIFYALSNDFNDLVNQFKIKCPKISIEASTPIQFRSAYRIFINIKGDDRKDFSAPCKKINELFKPKQIKIEPMYWYMFDRHTNNTRNNILNRLEQKQSYNIYFIFERKNLTLKVFCHSNRFNFIKEEIEKEIKSFTLKTEFISYRGKGLKTIQNFIEQIKLKIDDNQKQSRSIAYEVNYQRRQLQVTADLISLTSLKQQINKLQNIQSQVCKLCEQVMHQPYQLFNCNDSFCLLCLFNTIKETTSFQISCPNCAVEMNIYDIKAILTDEEFFKVCDRQVSKFVDKSDTFHSCFSPDCQQIFQIEESKLNGFFQCELCGKWYCFECKRQHKGVSCKQQIDALTLSKLGVKKCPKCGEGIQKNFGCNHMTCIKCRAHICWKCLKYFTTKHQCQDHLIKNHGGIFDLNYREEGRVRLNQADFGW